MKGPLALVDCNNFYASCERVFNPGLKGKPIVVLSNNDGMIIARSNEAKEMGIGMGEPLFKIKDMLEKNDVRVFSSNYTLYGDMSARVMTTLEQFTPNVEIYSIDEAFLNFEGFENRDLDEYCRHIKDKVLQWTGIPVSIGLAATKTQAKIANRIAKKNKQFDGFLSLLGKPDISKYLKMTDVSDIWGVGRQYTNLLYKHGIKNAYELSIANDKWVKKHMTVMGLRTVLELRGTPCITMEYSPPAKKAIVSSRSFGRPVTAKKDVKEAIALFTARAAEKMRLQKSASTLMTVFLRTNPFKENKPQYHNGCLVQLPVPTNSTAELLEYAARGVDQIFREGYEYNKVGIMLTGFVPFDNSQMALFETKNRQKMAVITDLVDKINLEMGPETIKYAATGTKRDWFMRREMLSPRYTTNWNELPEAKAGTPKNQMILFPEQLKLDFYHGR